jgi:hypothetical protein
VSLMLGKLYTALKDAGASESSAEAAATEVAGYESRPNKIETDLAVLKWMVSAVLAVCLTILFKVFS